MLFANEKTKVSIFASESIELELADKAEALLFGGAAITKKIIQGDANDREFDRP